MDSDSDAPLPPRVDREILKWAAREYHDLNGSHYEILAGPPSPLEFSRLARIGRPVLIKDAGIVDERYSWSDEYLSRKMGDREISVAVTPNGRADALTAGPGEKLYFAEPHVEKMTMASFLSELSAGHINNKPAEPDEDAQSGQEIYYLQSQNGNLYTARYFDLSVEEDPSEFEPLREDTQSEVTWCSDALDRSPDAVNVWIGDSKSVTSIHSDPYENIYTVVRGEKHFTLLPPTEGWCLEERVFPHARYCRSLESFQLTLAPSEMGETVRWSSIIDPNAPNALPPDAHPIQITVCQGEALYLPAGWWHYVRQTGVTVALNYWYDMEGRGMSWVWLNFLRGLGEPPSANSEEDKSDQK